MSQPNVPQELIEIITDEVASYEDDAQRVSALCACSRTSWSFLTPARKYLFAEVALVEDAGDDTEAGLRDRSRLEGFLQILANDPCLVYPEQQPLSMHTTSLKIQLSGFRAARNKRGFRARNEKRSFLPSILKSIPKIHTFSLSFDSRQTCYSWIFIDDSLKEALAQFCSSQPIINMELRYIHELPLTFLTNCLNLVSLSVHGLTEINKQLSHTPSQSSFSMLESLSVAYSSNFIEVLISLQLRTIPDTIHPRYSSLRRLETTLGRTEWGFIRSLPALSYLCISRVSEPFNQYSYLDLRRLESLQDLKLKWNFGHETNGLMSLLPVISPKKPGDGTEAEDTSNMTTVPISTLAIFGEWNFCTRRNEQQHFMSSAGWNSLDGVLSSDMFHNLRFIQFDLTLRYTRISTSAVSVEKYLLKKVQEKLPELLPTLSKSDLIQIRLDIHVATHE